MCIQSIIIEKSQPYVTRVIYAAHTGGTFGTRPLARIEKTLSLVYLDHFCYTLLRKFSISGSTFQLGGTNVGRSPMIPNERSGCFDTDGQMPNSVA